MDKVLECGRLGASERENEKCIPCKMKSLAKQMEFAMELGMKHPVKVRIMDLNGL